MQRHAIAAAATGGPEVLAPIIDTLVEPGPGQALVQVTYAGVNFWDVMQRRGDVPLPPDGVPGVEGVGIVAAVGPDASLAVGERVAWSKVPSSYASYVLADAASLVPVPEAVSDEQAAAVLMQGVTAQYLATSTTGLGAGEAAVVTAAAGGVGRLLIALLKARGVEVLGVVGSPAKVPASIADVTIVDGPDAAERVRDWRAQGVQAVFDATGGAVTRFLGMLAPRGILVLYGAAGGPIGDIPAGALAAGSFYVTRTAGRDYASAPGEWRGRADAVLAAAASGALTADVTRIAPLDDAAQVQGALEGRATTGKLLLRP